MIRPKDIKMKEALERAEAKEEEKLSEQSFTKVIDMDNIEKTTGKLIDQLHQTYGQKGLQSALSKLFGYNDTVPTIQEFLDDPKWLGNLLGAHLYPQGIYPKWREALYEIYPNPFYSPFSEVICLSGDTKVDLLDGRSISMIELTKEFKDRNFWVLAFDTQTNSYKPALANNPRMTQKSAKVYKVTLDNGKSFKATEYHPVLTRDNKWKTIKELKVGDPLKSYNKYTNEAEHDIIYRHDDKCWISLHKLVQEWKNGYSQLKSKFKKLAVHHKNFNKKDNRPENLMSCNKKKHIKYHAKKAHILYNIFRNKFPEKFKEMYEKIGKINSKKMLAWYKTKEGLSFKKEISKRTKEYWNSLTNEQKEIHLKNCRKSQKEWLNSVEGNKVSVDNLKVWRDSLSEEEYKEIIKERTIKGSRSRWSDSKQHLEASKRITKEMLNGKAKIMSDEHWNGENSDYYRKLEAERLTKRNLNPVYQKKTQRGKVLSFLNKLVIKFGKENITIKNYNNLISSIDGRKVYLKGIFKSYDCVEDKSIDSRCWKPDFEKLNNQWNQILEEAENYNHKIVSIEYVGEESVYNFEVENYHCFPLSCGIISHNCTGSIGTGKTTVALVGALYDLVRLAMMEDPHKQFKIIKTKKIVYATMNATLSLAGDVVHDQLYQMASESSKIRELFNRSRERGHTLFRNNIGIFMGSRSSHALGMDVIGAIMDEVNFQDKVADQAYNNYKAIKRRIESRFQTDTGSFPARVWMVSSKNRKIDFLDKHIEKNRKNKKVKVYDYPLWEVIGHKRNYSGKTFKVFIGDQHRDPRIIQSDLDKIGLGESRIIDVPIEHLDAFEYDLVEALKDIAGVSVSSVFKYIPSIEAINRSLKFKNPIYREVIHLDFYDSSDVLADYVDFGNLMIPQYKYCPRYIHIDMGLKHDRLGIASSFVADTVTLKKTDPQTGQEIILQEPVFMTEFLLTIESKTSSEIPIYKIKDFIVGLVNQGYPLGKVTMDGFQTENLKQDLLLLGINAEILSVDRTKDPYDSLKHSLLQNRWLAPKSEILKVELRELVDVGKKIDHPQDGSKDLSDSCAGSVFSAYKEYLKYPSMKSIVEKSKIEYIE